MPILANAKKALRRDKTRTKANRPVKDAMKLAIKTLKEKKDAKLLPAAYQAIDRAAKKNLIHKRKAAHLKSQLVKLFTQDKSTPAAPKAKLAKSKTKTKTSEPKVKTLKAKAKAKSVSKPKKSSK